jgi:hypothetical protein
MGVSQSLLSHFSSPNSNTRLIKVLIQNEEAVIAPSGGEKPITGSVDEDFSLIEVDPKEACYIFYNLKGKGKGWCMITFVSPANERRRWEGGRKEGAGALTRYGFGLVAWSRYRMEQR